jgi:hypothetical protein
MKNGLEIDEYGNKFYYLNDQLHREDGPAAECVNGDKVWWQHGLLHRLDGPAHEYSDGHKDLWYYYGKRIGGVKTFDQLKKKISLSIEREKIKLEMKQKQFEENFGK